MLAFSSMEPLELRLPVGTGPAFSLHLTVQVRDRRNCAVEVQVGPVYVMADQAAMDALLDMVFDSNDANSSNAIVEIFSTGNQNLASQVVTSFSQELNRNNKKSMEEAVAGMSRRLVVRRENANVSLHRCRQPC